jgi:nucleoside-diphosphate-sugar epimerase
MRVLVTGAAGRIGAHLTRALVARGHTVRAFVLPDDPRLALIAGPSVQPFYGRLEDGDAVALAAKDVDAVVHLGGALTSRGNTDHEFFEVNLRGTFNLLMALRGHTPHLQRFVFASSDAVYWSGTTTGACYLPVDEHHPWLAGSVYGASKLAAEELCRAFWRGHGIPVTILRFGATADAQELVEPRGVFARYLFLGALLEHLADKRERSCDEESALKTLASLDGGSAQLVVVANTNGQPEVRQIADARDIAEGCARVLEVPAVVGEVFNLGGTAPFAADELVRHLSLRLGLSFLTACLPTARAPWYITSAKARGMFGYAPRRSVFAMVDEALGAPS